MLNNRIETILKFELDSEYIAEILLKSEIIQKPDWESLNKILNAEVFKTDLKEDEIDVRDELNFVSYSVNEAFFITSINWAQGQGGLIAVWNCEIGNWVCIESCEFVYLSILIKELNLLAAICLISDYCTPYYETLDIFEIDNYNMKRIDVIASNSFRLDSLDILDTSTKLSDLGVQNSGIIDSYVGHFGIYYISSSANIVIDSNGILLRYTHEK
jgi:hypothetical protein